jgi:hypothetical protein
LQEKILHLCKENVRKRVYKSGEKITYWTASHVRPKIGEFLCAIFEWKGNQPEQKTKTKTEAEKKANIYGSFRTAAMPPFAAAPLRFLLSSKEMKKKAYAHHLSHETTDKVMLPQLLSHKYSSEYLNHYQQIASTSKNSRTRENHTMKKIESTFKVNN